MTPHYYKNRHGIDINEFLETIILDGLALAEGGYLFNLIKYNIRAGKKLGESAEKDLGKAEDYRQLLINHYGYKPDFLDKLVDIIKTDFPDFKGAHK